MARNGFALIAGVVLAMLLVALIQALGHTLFPGPGSAPDPSDKEAFEVYVQSLPFASATCCDHGALFASSFHGVQRARRRGASPRRE